MIWIAPSENDSDNAALENRLWDAADQFRANSGLKSQEYSAPVLGLIFLRSAEVRFIAQRAQLESPSPLGGERVGVRGEAYSGDPTRESIHGVEKTDETGRLCRVSIGSQAFDGHGDNLVIPRFLLTKHLTRTIVDTSSTKKHMIRFSQLVWKRSRSRRLPSDGNREIGINQRRRT